MNSGTATSILPNTILDDDAWDDLPSFIEERRVIPIVGPELLMVTTESGPRLLFDWLAGKLANRLNVDTTQLPPYTLNDVVCWFLSARGRREEAYVRLRSILKNATFDGLLEQAINQARFDGAPSTEVISYAPNRVVDLPAERDRLQRPVIYHLFGKRCRVETHGADADPAASARNAGRRCGCGAGHRAVRAGAHRTPPARSAAE